MKCEVVSQTDDLAWPTWICAVAQETRQELGETVLEAYPGFVGRAPGRDIESSHKHHNDPGIVPEC
jgi:hypothetical protein